MGVVWAAVNELVEGEVALKLLHGKNPELRRRLLREAKACGRLAHPNIVKIYDVGETSDGDPFLVMELLKGEPLSDRLRRERVISPHVAVGIAIDAARALRAAHNAGVIHRDLKPANIFLYRESDDDPAAASKLKVLDFGVSKLAIENEDTATLSGVLLGSPAYMSPEQAEALPIDGRADLWSLGIVLFEMLTGVRPFQSRSMTGVLAELLKKPIPRVDKLVPSLDPGLADVVASCLERDPDRRVKKAEDLIAMLRPFSSTPDAPPGSWDAAHLALTPPRLPSLPEFALPPDGFSSEASAMDDESAEHEGTSHFRRPERADPAEDPMAAQNSSESQRPTLELLPRRRSSSAGTPLLNPPASNPIAGAATAPSSERTEEATFAPPSINTPVPVSRPVDGGALMGATSTLSTTPVSHGARSGAQPEAIPRELRRWKVAGRAPLIAICASLGLATAAVVVFSSSSGRNGDDLSTASETATQPLLVSAPPRAHLPPLSVADSGVPPLAPSVSASASATPKVPIAPLRSSNGTPYPSTQKPLLPKGF